MRIFLIGALWLVLLGRLPAQESLLFAGPVAGANSPTSSLIWIQTTRAVPVYLRYWPEGEPGASQNTEATIPQNDKGYTAHFELENLLPGMTYRCEVWAQDKTVALSATPAIFTTQPDSTVFDFRLALGSCAYVNDDTLKSDRGLMKFGGGYDIFDTLASFHPEYMLWLGDNVYYRNGDWNSKASMHARYRQSRGLPGMRALLASGHHLAIWDDHDYGPNDSDGTYPLKDSSRQVFFDVWANPAPVTETGIYTRFRIGDVEIFLLDDRTFRSPITVEDGPDKDFLGKGQIDWLLEALAGSDASFKLVTIGTQVFSDTKLGEGYADDYGYEWQMLMDRLVESGVEGLVFLSGDKHYSEISRLDLPGFYPLFDLTVSPLTSQPTPFRLKNSRRLKKTFYNRRNFSIVHFVGRGDARRMQINLYKANGKLKWERTIWAKWLRVER